MLPCACGLHRANVLYVPREAASCVSGSRHVVHSGVLTNKCLSAQEGLNGEAPAAEEDADVSLDLTKKKKKKKKARASELEGLEEPEEGEGADADGDGGRTHAGLPWDGTDRDYSYEELLGMSRPAKRHCAAGHFVCCAGCPACACNQCN